jgi:DNA integrity scanning protein DisA with diadenylate cyclase activity
VDAQAKYRLWADAVGDEPLAARIFQTARDLSDAREGALFVVVREPDAAVPQLVPPADRLDLPIRDLDEHGNGSEGPSRRRLLHLLERRTITDLDPSVFMGLAALDGAIVIDRSGRLLAAGAILRHPPSQQLDAGEGVEGARTTAAMAASQFGPVLKVSEDGIITFCDRERVWDI